MNTAVVVPCAFKIGARWGWVVRFTSLPLYPGKRAHGTNLAGGLVGSRAGLDALGREKLPASPGN